MCCRPVRAEAPLAVLLWRDTPLLAAKSISILRTAAAEGRTRPYCRAHNKAHP
jgi:hypothetical protein